MQKNGEIAEDDSKRAHARLQKITEGQTEKVDALAARKDNRRARRLPGLFRTDFLRVFMSTILHAILHVSCQIFP